MTVSSHGPDANWSEQGQRVFEVQLVKPPGARLGIEVLILGASSGVSSGLLIDKINDFGVASAWNRTCPEQCRLRPGDVIARVNGIEGDDEALAEELRSGEELHLAIMRFGSQAAWQADDAARLMLHQMYQLHQFQLAQLQEQQARQRLLALQQAQQPSSWRPAGQGAGALPREAAGGGSAGSRGPGAAPSAGAPAGAATDAACLRKLFQARIVRPQSAKLGIGVLPVLVLQVDGLMVRHVSPGGAVDQWNQTCPEGYAIRAGDAIVCVNGIFCSLEKMMEEIRACEELQIAVLRQAAFFGTEAAPHPWCAAAGSEATRAPPQEATTLPEQRGPSAGPYPAAQSAAPARGGPPGLRETKDREGQADSVRCSHESLSEPTPLPTYEPFTGAAHRRQQEQRQRSQQRQQEEALHSLVTSAHLPLPDAVPPTILGGPKAARSVAAAPPT